MGSVVKPFSPSQPPYKESLGIHLGPPFPSIVRLLALSAIFKIVLPHPPKKGLDMLIDEMRRLKEGDYQ